MRQLLQPYNKRTDVLQLHVQSSKIASMEQQNASLSSAFVEPVAKHSNSIGQRVAKTGSNRPNGEQKQVQGLASVCSNPVRQRVWQKLKELSPS